MDDFSDEVLFGEERELTITEGAKASGVFENLWSLWRDKRAYRYISETDELVQVPLPQKAFPDSREDCDVIVTEYRKMNEDRQWQAAGRLLSLRWVRNVKPECRQLIDDWLTSIEDCPEWLETLSPEGRDFLEESRQKIQALMWKPAY